MLQSLLVLSFDSMFIHFGGHPNAVTLYYYIRSTGLFRLNFSCFLPTDWLDFVPSFMNQSLPTRTEV